MAGRPVRRLHKGWGLGLDQGNGWEVPQGRPPESPGGDLAVQRKQQQTSTEASGVEPLVPTGHASPSTSSEFLGLSRGLQTPPAASSCWRGDPREGPARVARTLLAVRGGQGVPARSMSLILAPTSRLGISRKWPQPRAWTPMGLRATCLGHFLEPPDPFRVTIATSSPG